MIKSIYIERNLNNYNNNKNNNLYIISLLVSEYSITYQLKVSQIEFFVFRLFLQH
jgi:hypothetical protein